MLTRCAEGRLDADLQAAVGQASARAGEAGGGAGTFQPADKKAAKRAQAQTWDLQRGVSAAARAALTGWRLVWMACVGVLVILCCVFPHQKPLPW